MLFSSWFLLFTMANSISALSHYHKRFSNDTAMVDTTTTSTVYITKLLPSSKTISASATTADTVAANKDADSGIVDKEIASAVTISTDNCPIVSTVTVYACTTDSPLDKVASYTSEAESTTYITDIVTATLPITAYITLTNSDGSSTGVYSTSTDVVQITSVTRAITITQTNTIYSTIVSSNGNGFATSVADINNDLSGANATISGVNKEAVYSSTSLLQSTSLFPSSTSSEHTEAATSSTIFTSYNNSTIPLAKRIIAERFSH